MTLADLEINDERLITKILGEDDIKARLLTLGFFTGNTVCVLHKSFRNALVKVGATRMAISSNLLETIEVEE